MDELAGYVLGEVIERDGFVRRQRATAGSDFLITRCAVSAPMDDMVESIAAASGQLSDGVVPITIGRDPSGQPYAVSPFRGTRLSKRMEAGPIDKSEALWLALDVARTLAAAHALSPSLVHGGIRPSAIVIDEKGFARLDDYGLGAVLASIAQSDSVILEMTARFQAPEHAHGTGRLPPESDRFSLASVIYEAITGRPAFAADSAIGALMRISMGKAGGAVDPRVGPELHALFASCWAKDRRKRIGAAALVLGLETLAGPVDPRVPKPISSPPSYSLEIEYDEPDPLDLPTQPSIEIPNHVPDVIAPYIPVHPTLRLDAMPLLPLQLPLPPHKRAMYRPPVAPLPREDMPTMRGETMAIAEILAMVGRPPIDEPIEETPIHLEPTVSAGPEVMEWRLLWTLVAMGAAVTMLLLTLLVMIVGAK